MKSARTSWLFLLAILALAFGLRWRGICHQLPQWTYLDGFVELVQTQYLRDPLSVKWPDMNLGYYPYLTSATAAVLPDMPAARGEGGAAESILEASREPWVRVRFAAILLSLGAVVGAWGIARRFVSSSFALLAAEQRPHGPASGMVALALWATLAFREQGTARSLSIAMLALCLAVAALQSSFALLVPLAIAWRWRDTSTTGRRSLVPAAIAGLALLAVTVRLAYPFHRRRVRHGRRDRLDGWPRALHRALPRPRIRRARQDVRGLRPPLARLGAGLGRPVARRAPARSARALP
jgi:hypothetical protein